jgi:VWFA-related protein
MVSLVWILLCPAARPQQEDEEITTREVPAVFQSRSNLVVVPVVVRDSQGRTTGDLRPNDFQLLDRGKTQAISRFSVERSGSGQAQTPVSSAGQAAAEQPEQNRPLIPPSRFVAYLFDDVHLSFENLVWARQAAARHLASLPATERAAVFTTSETTRMDFTADRDRLRETLDKLQPLPLTNDSMMDCPPISYYMADLIVRTSGDSSDTTGAKSVARMLASQCLPTELTDLELESLARRAANAGRRDTVVTLGGLRDAILRLAAAPGERVLVLVSPGFILPDNQREAAELAERAVRARIVVNTLDARGMYTDTMYQASTRAVGPANVMVFQFQHTEASAQSDILAELASATGGEFVQNNNDMDAGLRRLATGPEFQYVLGFSPENVKYDGVFHRLQVKLRNPKGFTVSARRGYYAPERRDDPVEVARREMDEAVFSRDETRAIPIELNTRFYKSSDDQAHLTVVARLDPAPIPFRKEAERNCADLKMVAVLFDGNGGFVAGIQSAIELRLRGETLERLARSGLSLTSQFNVAPGRYAIRLVVRDTAGALMSAVNGAVEIPY